jgi:outer membrane murein-binding lipoprotein Lpp
MGIAIPPQIWSSCKLNNRPAAETFGSIVVFEQFMQRGLVMDKTIVVKLAAAALVFALAGCTDLKPLQADIDSLKTQVGQLKTEVDATKASADAAARAASAAQASANQAASSAASAQSTANQALAAAQAAQSSVDATNEKIDRMFKKSVSK